MLSILAALALVSFDPTLAESKVQMSEPLPATCSVKFPTTASIVTGPCVVVALKEDDVLAVGFALEGGRILFIGLPAEDGIQVGAVTVNETPYEATGACVASDNQVTCAAVPVGGTNALIVQANY